MIRFMKKMPGASLEGAKLVQFPEDAMIRVRRSVKSPADVRAYLLFERFLAGGRARFTGIPGLQGHGLRR